MRRGKHHALAVYCEVAWRKALKPTSAAPERGPHRVDNAGRHVGSIATSEKSIGQAGRAGNAVCCQKCGKLLHPKRGSRRQQYCSYKCRDEARRARNFAASATTRRGSQPIPRSVENQPLVSNGCKADFVVRPPCIVGPAIVIEREVIDGRIWESVTSPDGVVTQVAAEESERDLIEQFADQAAEREDY